MSSFGYLEGSMPGGLLMPSSSASDVAGSTGSTLCESHSLTAPHWGVVRASQMLGSPGDKNTNMLLESLMEKM